MKLQAKQRLLASNSKITAAPFTQESVDTFLRSLGLNPEDFGKAEPALKKKAWQISINDDPEQVYAQIGKSLGRPVISDYDANYAAAMWNLKGKGAIMINLEYGSLWLVNATGTTLLNTAVALFDNIDEARYKSYSIDPKTKTLTYQPYERRGAAMAKKLLTKVIKSFGLNDWTLKMETAHWG